MPFYIFLYLNFWDSDRKHKMIIKPGTAFVKFIENAMSTNRKYNMSTWKMNIFQISLKKGIHLRCYYVLNRIFQSYVYKARPIFIQVLFWFVEYRINLNLLQQISLLIYIVYELLLISGISSACSGNIFRNFFISNLFSCAKII